MHIVQWPTCSRPARACVACAALLTVVLSIHVDPMNALGAPTLLEQLTALRLDSVHDRCVCSPISELACVRAHRGRFWWWSLSPNPSLARLREKGVTTVDGLRALTPDKANEPHLPHHLVRGGGVWPHVHTFLPMPWPRAPRRPPAAHPDGAT